MRGRKAKEAGRAARIGATNYHAWQITDEEHPPAGIHLVSVPSLVTEKDPYGLRPITNSYRLDVDSFKRRKKLVKRALRAR